MRVNDDYPTCNAKAQQWNSQSVHHFWRHALQRRKNCKEVFVYGSFECLNGDHPTVFSYARWSDDEKQGWVVVLNFSGEKTDWTVPKGLEIGGWLEANYEDGRERKTEDTIELRSWEGLAGRLIIN